jgi:hypothetical protein
MTIALGKPALASVCLALAWMAPPPLSAGGATSTAKAVNVCDLGVERVLPGDFYACKAIFQMQHGNYARALSMLEESARWANKNSQRLLGFVYFNGDDTGVAKNRPLGLAWLHLAAERNDPELTREYEDARAHSATDEVAAADALYLTMKDEFGDAVAGRRAMIRYHREVGAMARATDGSNKAIVYGFGPRGERADVVLPQLALQATTDFADLKPLVTVGPLESIDDPATGASPASGSSSP